MIVIGSGPSAENYYPPDCVKTICVNQAIKYHRADYWFSLDWSKSNIEIVRNRRWYPSTEFYCAEPLGCNYFGDDIIRLERISYRGVEPAEKDSPDWWIWRWSAVLGIPGDSRIIHSGNSAWGAIQLAYHLGARRVVLVGVDGTQDAKPDGTRPNRLDHLDKLIRSGLDKIEIRRLASAAQSTLTLETIDAGDVATWLSETT